MTGTSGNVTLRANQRFLKQIFGRYHERAHVCGVGGDPSEEGGNWSGGRADKRLASIWDKTNNYFCVSVFRGPLRRINEFAALMCLAVDDVGPKLDPDLVELLLGPPTWVIETSHGNFQWGYRLETPITDAGIAKHLIHRARVALTGEGEADPGMEAVTRYVRLPSGLNLKASLGKPWRVRLISCDPSIGLRSNTIDLLVGPRDPAGTTGQGILDADLDELGLRTGELRRSNLNNNNDLRGNINAEDALLKSLRKLGLVLGPPRATAMGWGFDLRCPWVDEHTDRAETGTVYVAGAGKFKCQHGHCIDRTVEDLRRRLDELLRDNGHAGGLIAEEFDVVDPEAMPVPPQGLRPKPGVIENTFFDRYVVMLGKNRFFDLASDHEVTALDIDTYWAKKLISVLPKTPTGPKKQPVMKPLSPSRWLLEDGRCRRVVNHIGWPGKPRVVTPDPLEPTRLFINTWEPMKRPLQKAADAEVSEKAIGPWLQVFWHFIGTDTLAQWEIGEVLLDWMALCLGDQSLKAGWHVVLMGQQGVGKDSIILPVAATLGPLWAQTIQSQQIGADFNEWAGRRLVQISEARQNTRGSLTGHDAMAILKAIFDNTREWLTINPKYLPKHTVRNVVMGWFTSNEREPLMLEPGDRRFVVLDRSEVRPMPLLVYAQLHKWLTGADTNGMARVAEFLYRRWEQMPEARRKVLFGTAPMTEDKQALLSRLKHPVEDWMERCIAMGPGDPLTFPDIVTASYVHSRLSTAIRTGGEGLPGGVYVPSLQNIVLHLKGVGAVALNDGKQIRVNGTPLVLYAVRDPAIYGLLAPNNLAKVYTYGVGGSGPGTIN